MLNTRDPHQFGNMPVVLVMIMLGCAVRAGSEQPRLLGTLPTRGVFFVQVLVMLGQQASYRFENWPPVFAMMRCVVQMTGRRQLKGPRRRVVEFARRFF